jgi:ABC-2 type transport system permease protein
VALIEDGLLHAPTRVQYEAVARMRWRMLVNSFRTPHGKFELTAQALITGFFACVWLTAGIGFGVASWRYATDGKFPMLATLLWPVLIAWQLIPVILGALQGNIDLTFLLRFPVTFRGYVFLYICLGCFDLSSLMGGLTLLGMWIGTVLAHLELLIWMTMALVLFAVFNLLLTKATFAWLDKFLAQRRTRVVFGAAVLILLSGLTILRPVLTFPVSHRSLWLPPDLIARALQMAEEGRSFQAGALLSLLAVYPIVASILLAIRLHAEYRGETLSEVPGVKLQASRPEALRRLRWLEQVPGSFGALVQKELICFSRNGLVIFHLTVPLLVVFFWAGGMRTDLGLHISQYVLPLGIAIAIAPFSRHICNSFGGEGPGIQLCFLSPTRVRSMILAKNILHFALIGLEAVLVFVIVLVRQGMPSRSILVATSCWLLFAAPAQLAAGNVLSLTMAYRMTKLRISSEPGATSNGMLGLLLQVSLIVAGLAIYLPLSAHGRIEMAGRIFLLLAAGTALSWLVVLSQVDRMAASRREVLLARLVRI